MKLWTYAEARDKLLGDQDLRDQTFVLPNELIGYFNEGIEDAEGEILKIDEDYLLTSKPVPLVTGTSAYALPSNMYAFKLRGIVYANGATIYPVKKFRRRDKFEKIAYALQYSNADDYRYYLTNGDEQTQLFNLVPASRETAIVPPVANPFTPMLWWYIRQAKRIPLLGEFILHYEDVSSATAVLPLTDIITVAKTYVTGDEIKLTTTGTIPGGLVSGTVYYAISASSTTLRVATSLVNAKAGTAIDITSAGTGILSISIAANQTIVDNTVIDIPEFVSYVIQFAKWMCFDKEGDPRAAGAAKKLSYLKDQMVAALTEAQPDDENTVEADFNAYNESS